METRGRALYNLIQMTCEEDPSLSFEPWQLEDYRALSLKELFNRLKKLGISLDESRFFSYAESAASPEELAETLWVEEEMDQFDKAYLLIFELWRRLQPEKLSLSIFCDELDHLIELYDQDLLADEELLQDALAEFERVLDEHVDQGVDPHRLFDEISLYCAHDLETFIYDFASEEIDQTHYINASEMIDAFTPYIRDKKWYEFLELRLLANTDSEAADAMLSRILEDQKKDPDFELLLEIGRFLVNRGSIHQFIEIIRISRTLIQTEEDFQELLGITYEFYRLLDQEEKMEKVSNILKKRQNVPLEKEIASNHKDFKDFFRLIEDFDRSEA